MIENPIPVFRPSLDVAEVWKELEPVLRSGWLGTGAKVEELERLLAWAVGAKHFVCTSSGTAALHLAVKSWRLPRGSRVLTTPITFISTNAALLWAGLVPVFGEVDQGGLLISPHRTGNTVATMAVHLGGAECKLASSERGFPVIEDCAHAFGAPWIDSQPDNTRCWSFHAVKGLPMGDGGGLSTNNHDIAEEARRLRWMGIDSSTFTRYGVNLTRATDEGNRGAYDIPELGYKYAMNDITAAIGIAALRSRPDQDARRRAIAARYALANIADQGPGYMPLESSCHFYPLFFDEREKVQEALTLAGISFSRHYRPNFEYDGIRQRCAVMRRAEAAADRYWSRALILPIFPTMTDQQVDRVIAAVRSVE